MEKTRERKNLTSGEFVKTFIITFVTNAIFISIFIGFVYEIVKESLPVEATTVLSFVLAFVAIVTIYLSAIKSTFSKGKIYQEDINKIAKNIVIVFVVLLVIDVGLDCMSYINRLSFFKGSWLEDIIFRNFIINIIMSIVMNIIIAIVCRLQFLKECKKPDNII